MKKQFTEKDLVDFGNYLLSEERSKNIENKENLNQVHDCDIENFLELTKNKKLTVTFDEKGFHFKRNSNIKY